MNHEAVLLAMILRNEDIWYLAGMRLDYFESVNGRAIFKAMEEALKNHGYISRDTVVSHLVEPVILDRAIREAESEIGTARWEFHRAKVIENWKRRAMGSAYLEAKDVLENNTAHPDEIADQLITDIQSIRTENSHDASISYKQRVRMVLDILGERHKLQGALPGLSTGIRSIDSKTGGLQKRRYYLVGARPSQGKSALLGQMADHIARQGIPVGYFSLESGADEIIIRNWAREHSIDQSRLNSGMITPKQFVDLDSEVQKHADLPLWIDDTPNTDITHIRRQAQIWKARNDIQALFVDYVQLIRVHGSQSRRESVEEASRSLKDISRHLDIPVIAAAQLRRDVDDRAPHLGDFQHSSALEQDADVGILLQWMNDFGQEMPVDAIIAKNRDGEKSKVKMIFQTPYLRFIEATGVLDE